MKTDWKSQAFWLSVLSQILGFVVLVGLFTQQEASEIGPALERIVTGIFALAAGISTIVAYLRTIKEEEKLEPPQSTKDDSKPWTNGVLLLLLLGGVANAQPAPRSYEVPTQPTPPSGRVVPVPPGTMPTPDYDVACFRMYRGDNGSQSLRDEIARLREEVARLRQQSEQRPAPQAAPPIMILPIAGSPYQYLPVPGAPRQDLPAPGAPRMDLPAPGAPKQALPAPGGLLFELKPYGGPKMDLPDGGTPRASPSAPRMDLPPAGTPAPLSSNEAPAGGGYIRFSLAPPVKATQRR